MSKVYFMHLRNIDFNNQISNFGGTTIAYREVHDGVEYAESWCSANDNFNKAYGRAKAQGRMNSQKYRRIFPGTLQDFRQAIDKELI